jgi:CHAT domain-containing protein/Tfp pilus assembly protein PilF
MRAVLSLLLVLVLAGESFAAAPPPRLKARQAEQLAQRQHWLQRASAHWRAGEIDRAIAAVDRGLALERAALGSLRAGSLPWLSFQARLHEQRDQYARALGPRQEVLEGLRQLHGQADWRVTDARLDLEDTRRQARLGARQRQQLRQARQDNDQVVRLWQQGRSKEALPLAERALVARRSLLGDWHRHTGESWFNLGAQHEALHHVARARSCYRQALAIRTSVLGEMHPVCAASLNNLASLDQHRGDYKAALPLFQQALHICKTTVGDEHPLYSTCLNNLALLYQAMGDHQAALPLFQQALQVSKAALGEKHPEYATSLNNLALVYHRMGDHQAALPLLRQALAIRKVALGEKHPEYATSLNSLAQTCEELGDHQTALRLLRQAARIRKEVLGEKHPDYATSLHNLAVLHKDMGDHQAALVLFRQVLHVTREARGEEHPEYAQSLGQLAMLYQEMGDPQAALPLCEKALRIFKATLGDKHPDHAICLTNLALLYKDVGKHQAAVTLFQAARQLCKATLGEKHSEYATTLHNLAGLYQDMGDRQAALPLLEQAVRIDRAARGEKHPFVARNLHGLAGLYQGMKRPREAHRVCEQALALTRARLLLVAAVQSERQQLAAVAADRPQLDLRLSLTDPPGEGPAGSYQHVLAWKGAVFLQQQQRRQLARLLASSRREARTLVERLQHTTRRLAALTLAPVDARTALRREQAEKLTQEKEELESRLSTLSAGFREQQKQSRVRPADVQQTLPADIALVDFLFYTHHDYTQTERGKRWQRRLSAWVVRRGTPLVRVDLGPAEPIEQAVWAWRKTLTRSAGGRVVDPKLYRALWQPLAEHLGGVKTVLISPDGALAQVPFGALPGRREGNYLIEEVALAVVPVPQLLPQLLAPVPRAKGRLPSLLVVGDVDFATSGAAIALADSRSAPRGALQEWGRLPATSAEADAVRVRFARLFPEAAVTDLRKEKASRSAVRQALAKSRYAHLATHGFFAPPELKSALVDLRPGAGTGLFGREGVTGWHPLLLSGLVLAGANKELKPGEEDGILTALEVSELDLSGLELTVLSACESGLGTQAGGEGLLGLQRAFAVAGCRSVVASLWQVPDEATGVLMQRFYDNLWRRQLSRLEALREAQRWVLREGGRHPEVVRGLERRGMKRDATAAKGKQGSGLPPLFWGAFVLSGDWR